MKTGSRVRMFIVFTLLLTVAVTAMPKLTSARESATPGPRGGAKSYIVPMANDPIVAYKGDIPGYGATKPGTGEKVNLKSAKVRKYQMFLSKRHSDSLAAAGVDVKAKVHDYAFALNGYSAILTEAEVKALKAQVGVVTVLEDRMRYKQTDSSPAFLGLTAGGGAYAKYYTGERVVVGVIDTGIWPEHPSFADDGSYAPPLVSPLACEFGNMAHNPNDAPFTCNNKLIGARRLLDTYKLLIGLGSDEFDSERDDDGHGTHTASTAAGNAHVEAAIYGRYLDTISGIAPRAYVVAYKALGNLGGYTSDLAAAIDQAVADGVDVINHSIGGGAAAVQVRMRSLSCLPPTQTCSLQPLPATAGRGQPHWATPGLCLGSPPQVPAPKATFSRARSFSAVAPNTQDLP